jgi:hypothetical protein
LFAKFAGSLCPESVRVGFTRVGRNLRKGEGEMGQVSIEVQTGGSNLRLAVCAESIQRAKTLADDRFPGCSSRVLFPIEAEAFFVEGVPVEELRFEMPEAAAV